MNLVACSGDWLSGPNGEAVCQGTLQIVGGVGPLGLPPLTYTEANMLLGAVGGVFVIVWGIRTLMKLL